MNNRLAVFNTDSLNRAGILFPTELLVRGFLDNGRTGMPYLLNHDFHKRLGWTVHNGILLQPAMIKTIGNIFIPTNEEENEKISVLIQNAVNENHYEGCKEHIDRFLALLGESCAEDGRFLYDCCVAYKSSGILNRIYPSLKYDKDGLVFLDELLNDFEYLGSGVFANKRNNFAVFAHQYFRRNLSHQNNTNNDFLDRFISRRGNIKYRLRIALDDNLIALKDTYQPFLEQDFAWGPKFTNDISSISDGVTQYLYPEDEQKVNGIKGMEFWWKTDDGEKTLEAEEICIDPSLGISDTAYGCRYIHSIYDAEKASFVHFDGAVRLYDEETILSRWDNAMNKAGKNTEYTKLFRIDGQLPLEDWKELIIFYFRGNKLPYEYFGVKEDLEEFMEVHEDKPVDFSLHVPYKTKKENGVQLFVSIYPEHVQELPRSRVIIDLDQIEIGSDKLLVSEYHILEIKKILERDGEELFIPQEVEMIKTYDYYSNFPTILHSDENTTALVDSTLSALRRLFTYWNAVMTKTVSFALAIPFEGELMKISVFGEISSVLKWMDNAGKIPLARVPFEQWLVEQATWLRNNFEHKGNGNLQHLIRPDGIQLINRIFIDKKYYQVEEKDGGMVFSFSKNLKATFITELEKGLIYPSILALLKDIRCSRTGKDYRKSATSKILDEDVQMIIHSAEQLGVFWTDKPYY